MCLRTHSELSGLPSTWPARENATDPVWNSARRLHLPEADGGDVSAQPPLRCTARLRPAHRIQRTKIADVTRTATDVPRAHLYNLSVSLNQPTALHASAPCAASATRRARCPIERPRAAQLFLSVEVWESKGLLSAESTLLGSGLVALRLLRAPEPTRVFFAMRPGRLGRCAALVSLGREPPLRKTVFFVRHGQSVWNKAQKDLNVLAMVSAFDHPLNAVGRQQAEALQLKLSELVSLAAQEEEGGAARRGRGGTAVAAGQQSETPGRGRAGAAAGGSFAEPAGARPLAPADVVIDVGAERGAGGKADSKAAADTQSAARGDTATVVAVEGKGKARRRLWGCGCGGRVGATGLPPSLLSDLERDLVGVQLVASSPLTRAMQTTAIALGPLMRKAGCQLRVMANLREKKNLGGQDSSGAAVGARVTERLITTVGDLYKDAPESGEKVVSGLQVDTAEVESKWWSDLVESKEQMGARLRELLWQLHYAPEERIALVGHSHFLRELFRAHLSPKFRTAHPEQARGLTTQLVSNCGVVALTLDFTERELAYATLGPEVAFAQSSTAGVIEDVELMLGTTLVGSPKSTKH